MISTCDLETLAHVHKDVSTTGLPTGSFFFYIIANQSQPKISSNRGIVKLWYLDTIKYATFKNAEASGYVQT